MDGFGDHNVRAQTRDRRKGSKSEQKDREKEPISVDVHVDGETRGFSFSVAVDVDVYVHGEDAGFGNSLQHVGKLPTIIDEVTRAHPAWLRHKSPRRYPFAPSASPATKTATIFSRCGLAAHVTGVGRTLQSHTIYSGPESKKFSEQKRNWKLCSNLGGLDVQMVDQDSRPDMASSQEPTPIPLRPHRLPSHKTRNHFSKVRGASSSVVD